LLGGYGYYVGWPVAIVLLASPFVLPVVIGSMMDRRITPLKALQYILMIPMFVVMQVLLWALMFVLYVGPFCLPLLVLGKDNWLSYILGAALVILTVKYLGTKIENVFESVVDKLTSILPEID